VRNPRAAARQAEKYAPAISSALFRRGFLPAGKTGLVRLPASLPRPGPRAARGRARLLAHKDNGSPRKKNPRAPGRAQTARRVPLGVLLWARHALLLLKTRHAVRRPPRCTHSETRAMGRQDVCVRHTESACPAHW
jgi:hypothetical protein